MFINLLFNFVFVFYFLFSLGTGDGNATRWLIKRIANFVLLMSCCIYPLTLKQFYIENLHTKSYEEMQADITEANLYIIHTLRREMKIKHDIWID